MKSPIFLWLNKSDRGWGFNVTSSYEIQIKISVNSETWMRRALQHVYAW